MMASPSKAITRARQLSPARRTRAAWTGAGRVLSADAYQEEPTDEREGEPADDCRGNQGAVGSAVDERCDEDVLVALRRANVEGQDRRGRLPPLIVGEAAPHAETRRGDRTCTRSSRGWTRDMKTERTPTRLNTRSARAPKSRSWSSTLRPRMATNWPL